MSVRSTATDRRTHVQRTVLQQCCDDIGHHRQGQNTEHGGQDDGTGDLLFIIVELHGENRTDGGARTGFEQQDDLGGHAEADMQEAINQQAYRRNQYQANADDGENGSVPDHLRKLRACEYHTGDHHTDRSVQPTNL